MAIEFKYNINSMLTGPSGSLTDVVKQISYTLAATDSGQAVSTTNTVQLPPPDTENFVDFNNLTEEQVIGWLDSTEQAQVTKTYLADQLQKKIAEMQLQVKRPPWVPDPGTVPLPPAP